MAENSGFFLFVSAALGDRRGCCDILGTSTQLNLFLTAKPLWVVTVGRATGVCIHAGLPGRNSFPALVLSQFPGEDTTGE